MSNDLNLADYEPRLWVTTVFNYWRNVQDWERVLFGFFFVWALLLRKLVLFPFYKYKY